MRFYYPRSFFKLLAVGFALVALPLIVALVNNAISVDRLANRSQRAVYQAAQATQASRRLAELLTAVERNARQIMILGDRSLLDAYVANRGQLAEAAAQFARLPFDGEQKKGLEEILRIEQSVYQALSDPAAKPAQVAPVIEQFVAASERAQAIIARSNQLIDREVESMRETADKAQRIVLWQLLALVPVAVFLVVGFTILIARPIRELDSAIRRLGSGQLAGEVAVSGPEDLEYLGGRLEWMRRELIDLEQQKNRFLRQVSHELKTPLTALREGAELLTDEVVGKLTPEQREIAEIVRHNSMELQKLIEDLLNYGAVQFQKFSLEVRPVRIREVIERVAEDQKLALKVRNLRLDVDAVDATVAADAEKMRVIIDNLVSNAIKFSPPGAAIGIAAAVNGERMSLDVIDSGPGIAAEDRPRIFEPFYQGRAAASGPLEGTGIGLSVVREYVVAHHGEITVVDDPGRAGAHLRVTLPLAHGGGSQ